MNEKGVSVLHIAASLGHMELVQWLTVHLTDLDAETPTAYTAIHQAAMTGHTNIMMVREREGLRGRERWVLEKEREKGRGDLS